MHDALLLLLFSFREVVGKKVMNAIKRNDDGISFSCVDFLCALMQPMHDNFDLRQEQLNKRSLLSSKGFLEKLLQPLKDHVVSRILTLCHCGVLDGPYSDVHGVKTCIHA